MKTKEQIKEKGRELFNEQGLSSITLRDVAAALNKSYGNITYHFASKEVLVSDLYFDMVKELQSVSASFAGEGNLLEKILNAPKQTFHTSIKYLFLLKDYVYIIRTYPQVAEAVKISHEWRKQSLKKVLMCLLAEGILRKEMKEKDILYLMELSGAMRTFFFLQLTTNELEKPTLQMEYVSYVNQLLYPYLSEKGQNLYEAFISQI